MDDSLFDELVSSVKEAKAVQLGEVEAYKVSKFSEAEVSDIRSKHGLTQNQFASILGISIGTLRNWEQGRRKPEGPARILLRVFDKHPEAFEDLAVQ